jgi:hypothetical protein
MEVIPEIEKIYRMLYDNRGFFQIFANAEALKLGARISNSAFAISTTNVAINIMKAIKKRKK